MTDWGEYGAPRKGSGERSGGPAADDRAHPAVGDAVDPTGSDAVDATGSDAVDATGSDAVDATGADAVDPTGTSGQSVSDPSSNAVRPAPTVPAPPASRRSVPDTVERAGLGDHLAPLDTLAQRPLAEHAEVYDQIHQTLQRSLAEIENA